MFKQSFFLVLIALLLIQQALASGPCNNGTLVGNYCYCDSGYNYQGPAYSGACWYKSSNISPSSASAPGVDYLYLELLSDNTLRSFVRYAYSYEGRKNYTASYNGLCHFPTASSNTSAATFYKEGFGYEYVDTHCKLQDVLKCGWNATQDSSMKYYSGTFELSFTDDVGRGYAKRTVEKFPITVSFPKSIAVSNSIQVQKTEGGVGPLDLFARITSQTVIVQTKQLIMEMTTEVNYPARIAWISSAVLPAGVTVVPAGSNLTLVRESCSVGSVCTQIWSIQLATWNCRFNGQYKYGISLACNGAYGGSCPYIGQSVEITDSLTAESLCWNGNVGVGASGTLTFHSDNTLSTVKTSFSTETAFAKVRIATSPLTPTSVSIQDLVVYKQYSGQNAFLISGGAVTGFGSTANFNLFKSSVESNSAEIGFSFSPSAFVESNNPSLYQSFTIYATVQLNFAGTQRTALVELKMQENNQLSTKISAPIEVSSKQVTNAASMLSASFYLLSLLVGLVIFAL